MKYTNQKESQSSLKRQLKLLETKAEHFFKANEIDQAVTTFKEALMLKKKLCGEDSAEFLRSADFLADILAQSGDKPGATQVRIWAMTPLGHEAYSLFNLGESEDSSIELLFDIICGELRNNSSVVIEH